MDSQQKELARQHTKAVLALTTLTGPLEVLEPAVMPGCDVDGTALYMMLNGYDWHKQEALMKDAA